MYVRKKKNKSGSVSLQIISKTSGKGLANSFARMLGCVSNKFETPRINFEIKSSRLKSPVFVHYFKQNRNILKTSVGIIENT